VLWWDTPYLMTKERAELLAPLLTLQPGIITNNRLGGGYMGDTETPENKIPATGYPRDWEACMTMNDTWGFKSWDQNWKSTERIVRNLIDIASKGGNYLLNVGPTAEGEIPAPSIERLKQVGAWMRKNGESIYGTKASPFQRLAWGRATRKGDKLYLNVFFWPADGELVVPMRHGAQRAYLLGAADTALKLEAAPDGLHVTLPLAAPDPISSVVVLEGVGSVDPLPPPPIAPEKDGTILLGADAAELVGKGLRVEGNTQLSLANWRTTGDVARWEVQIERAGAYEVTAQYATSAEQVGSEFLLSVGDQTLTGPVAAGAKDNAVVVLGTVRVDKTGPTQISLKPAKIGHEEFMRLRALTLKPVVAP
jgi:alpha-L-fucosidase